MKLSRTTYNIAFRMKTKLGSLQVTGALERIDELPSFEKVCSMKASRLGVAERC